MRPTEGEAAADDAIGNGDREQNIGETCEGKGEDKEEDRGHDEAQAVHWEVVVHAVREEVKHEECGLVWKESVNVEQESVEGVFEDSPNDVADKETKQRLCERGPRDVEEGVEGECGGSGIWEGGPGVGWCVGELKDGKEEEKGGDGEPEDGYDVPRRAREHFQVV